MAGDNRLDEALLAALAGGRIARADAARVREHTGFAIGGVAPLGSLGPLRVFCDADLLAHEYVWAAAGAPHAVFRVAAAGARGSRRGRGRRARSAGAPDGLTARSSPARLDSVRSCSP